MCVCVPVQIVLASAYISQDGTHTRHAGLEVLSPPNQSELRILLGLQLVRPLQTIVAA